MAEKRDDEDNPFSFKSFVSGKDRKTPTLKDSLGDLDLNVDDIFATDESSSLGLPKQSLPKDTNIQGGTKAASKKSKPKENPFSFKKFLSGSSGSNHSNDALARRTQTLPKPAEGASYSPSDELSGSSNTKVKSAPPGIIDLLGESRNGLSNSVAEDVRPHQRNNLFFSSDDEDTTGVASNISLPGPSIPSVLPDFLSDGAALTASSAKASSMTHSTHDDLLSHIQTLQEENAQLRKDLAAEKRRCCDKNQRLSQLQIDMERQKKKEAEETKVMEKAVLQVEENLATTTQRAVQAESTILKLKQEIKTLQNQVKLLSAENHMLQSGDAGLSDIRERTKYTADELVSASAVAEKNIKELSAGVEKLKLLSQVLLSLEKVSEVKQDTAADNESKVS